MAKDRVNPIQVRLPGDLLAGLRDNAAKNNRTLNGEIVGRLEASTDKTDDPELAALIALVRATIERVGGIVTLLDGEHRLAELTKVRGAVDAIFEALGSPSDDRQYYYDAGRAAGKGIIEYARAASAKAPSERTDEEAALAEAAGVWGLQDGSK